MSLSMNEAKNPERLDFGGSLPRLVGDKTIRDSAKSRLESFLFPIRCRYRSITSRSVSDLKLYEIQASRVPGPPGKFQVPQIALSSELLSTYLKFHIFNNEDNPENATRFINLIIFRLWLILITFFLSLCR